MDQAGIRVFTAAVMPAFQLAAKGILGEKQ